MLTATHSGPLLWCLPPELGTRTSAALQPLALMSKGEESARSTLQCRTIEPAEASQVAMVGWAKAFALLLRSGAAIAAARWPTSRFSRLCMRLSRNGVK